MSQAVRANSGNHLAGFEALLRGEGKERKTAEKEIKERDERVGEKPSEINLWLRP